MENDRDQLEIKHRDFFWTYTEEPHRTRRLAIIKAHPEVHVPPLPFLGLFTERPLCRSRSSADQNP
jgi:hypothetical protein